MEEVVLEEPLDVFAAVDGSPVRPGAVDEVEEGEVGDSVSCQPELFIPLVSSRLSFPPSLLFFCFSPLLSISSHLLHSSLFLLLLLKVKQLTEVPAPKAP